MQTLGKLEPFQRALVLWIDAMAADVVEELLDVERISLGARKNEIYQSRGWLSFHAKHLPKLCPDQQHRMIAVQLGERNLVEMRKTFDAQAPTDFRARPVGEQDQNAKRRKRPG